MTSALLVATPDIPAPLKEPNRIGDNVRVFSALTADVHPNRIAFRTPTLGPEYDVVLRFHEEHLRAEDGSALTIFIEPKVEGAFPDVVAVYWNPDVTDDWKAERRLLQRDDIKQLQYVQLTGRMPIADLQARLGKRRGLDIAERLLAADVVERCRNELRRKPLRENFAVSRIAAFEAKINDWRKGLEQAMLNSWFASETYLLLPTLPSRGDLLAQAQRLGIGVVTEETGMAIPKLKAHRERIPRSYASWLFNEWAWLGDEAPA